MTTIGIDYLVTNRGAEFKEAYLEFNGKHLSNMSMAYQA
jgi:hypothetical protein